MKSKQHTPNPEAAAAPEPSVDNTEVAVSKSSADRLAVVSVRYATECDRVAAFEQKLAERTEAAVARLRQVALGDAPEATASQQTEDATYMRDLERDLKHARNSVEVLTDLRGELAETLYRETYEAAQSELLTFCRTQGAKGSALLEAALAQLQKATDAGFAIERCYEALRQKVAVPAVILKLIQSRFDVGRLIPLASDLPECCLHERIIDRVHFIVTHDRVVEEMLVVEEKARRERVAGKERERLAAAPPQPDVVGNGGTRMVDGHPQYQAHWE